MSTPVSMLAEGAFVNFPGELLNYFPEFTDWRDVNNLATTCTALNKRYQDDVIWKPLFERYFPDVEHTQQSNYRALFLTNFHRVKADVIKDAKSLVNMSHGLRCDRELLMIALDAGEVYPELAVNVYLKLRQGMETSSQDELTIMASIFKRYFPHGDVREGETHRDAFIRVYTAELCRMRHPEPRRWMFPFLSPALRDNNEMALAASMSMGCAIFEFTSERLNDNREFVLDVLNYNLEYILEVKHLSPTLKNDEEIALIIVKKDAQAFKFLGDGVKDNEKIAQIALDDYCENYHELSERLKNKPEYILAYLENRPPYYGYANLSDMIMYPADEAIKQQLMHELKCDEKSLKAAATIWAIDRVKSEFGENAILPINYQESGLVCALNMIQVNPAIMSELGEFYDNERVMTLAVEEQGALLKYASTRIKDDESIVRVALANTNDPETVLSYASERLQEEFKNYFSVPSKCNF